MKELDLDTLKAIKFSFELFSDFSTQCLGYNYICNQINNIENKIKIQEQKQENAFQEAEELIEVLNEHRT